MTEDRPSQRLDVAPVPVGAPRGGGRAAWLVLLAVAGAVAVAVLAALVVPPTANTPPPSAAASPAPGALAAAPVTHAPDPSAILAATPPRLSRDALVAAIRDGSLEGRLVFADGEIRATPVPCAGPGQGAAGCVDLAIPGIGVPVSQGESAIPWTRYPPRGAWLVTVARGSGLVYLGSLVPWEHGPRSLAGIQAWRDSGGNVFEAGTLLEADGWLVVDPVHACPARGSAATPCPAPPPFLATDEPMPDGLLVSDAGQAVDVASPLPGVDPGVVVTGGTFLVASVPGTDRDWRVIARYIPARSVRVLVP